MIIITDKQAGFVVRYCTLYIGERKAWIGNRLIVGEGWRMYRSDVESDWKLSVRDKQMETYIGIKFA